MKNDSPRVDVTKAEIIAVGSELLTPDHLDTNSLYLTDKLWEAGFDVHLKTVVRDNEREISDVLGAALRRSKVVIITGGLGPTEDDLTRTAVARSLNRTISVDSGIVEALARRFASRGYTMAKINERQAEVITGAVILPNSFGTAPGQWIEHEGIAIALLPGPPREVRPMFEAYVLPRLHVLGGARRMAKRSFIITGLTESEVDSQVAAIYRSYPSVQTTILSSPGGISLNLYQWIEEGREASDIEQLSQRIQAILGNAIFTSSGEPLEEVVGHRLRQSGLTLAVAESCTAGLVAWRITRMPGSSDYFRGGVLCYSNEVKVNLCGVDEEVLKRHGAVSSEVAEALAAGVRDRLKTSIGLAVTGLAGPGGGSQEKPVGLVYIGISDGERTIHARRILPGDRDLIRERAAYFAISSLRAFLRAPRE